MKRLLTPPACPRLLALTLILFFVAPPALLPAPARRQTGPQAHFYSVDSERRIEGVIKDLLFEPRYEDRAPFLILLVEVKEPGALFRVETSPAWFFDNDLHKGEKVKVLGSYYQKDGLDYLIARQIQAGGQTFTLRDSRGFPSWRGGPSRGKGWRRGRG
jgi:hypothetical protein